MRSLQIWIWISFVCFSSIRWRFFFFFFVCIISLTHLRSLCTALNLYINTISCGYVSIHKKYIINIIVIRCARSSSFPYYSHYCAVLSQLKLQKMCNASEIWNYITWLVLHAFFFDKFYRQRKLKIPLNFLQSSTKFFQVQV